MKLDQLDIKILELLQKSEMLTPKLSKIANAVSSTNATVYRRIEALKNEGIIIGHTTQIDGKLVGKNLQAMIYLRVSKNLDRQGREEMIKRLTKVDEVEGVYVPMSHWSYLLKMRTATLEDLDKFLQEELIKFPMEEIQIEIISRTLKEGTSIMTPKK